MPPEAIKVEILAASYNGAGFLASQLDSLVGQTRLDWCLRARDDGSVDGSAELFLDYARRFPDRMLVQRNEANLGAVATFNLLLQEADADWIFLCDQDDVWLPDKVAKTLAVARQAERCHGRDTPLLIHTDLRVVDKHLNPVADSLWRYQKSDPAAGRYLNRLLLQNAVTGCTVAINRSLRDLALPIPAGARMHDWWLALTAAAFGHIEYLAEPTVLYRQHGGNVAGAQLWDTVYTFGLLGNLAEVRRVFKANQQQAAVFLEYFRDRLKPELADVVEAYATFEQQSFLQRRMAMVRYGFSYPGRLRNWGFWVLG